MNRHIIDWKKKINDIANGSEKIIGNTKIKWSSGGIDHTHQYLVSRGITILENDKGYNAAKVFYDYAPTILYNADWPDQYETDGITYKGHFYDVKTGKNWLGGTSPTAKTRFIYWAEKAKLFYNTNIKKSMQSLGRALHYLADMNVPHHAQNHIVGISDHSNFEKWVDVRRKNYQTNTTKRYSQYFGSTWEEICAGIADYSATQAGQVEFKVNPFGYAYLADSYDRVATVTMDNSQQNMAAFLFKFLKVVGEV